MCSGSADVVGGILRGTCGYGLAYRSLFGVKEDSFRLLSRSCSMTAVRDGGRRRFASAWKCEEDTVTAF